MTLENTSIYVRAAMAIVFATLSSGLVAILLFVLVLPMIFGADHRPLMAFDPTDLMVRLMTVQLIFTALFALLVEWPKTAWLIRRKSDSAFVGNAISLFIAGLVALGVAYLSLDHSLNQFAVHVGNEGIFLRAISLACLPFLSGRAIARWWRQFVVLAERQKCLPSPA